MPVYNEHASIGKVVREWMAELDAIVGNFAMLVIDDGSRDSTLTELMELRRIYGPKLEIISRPNRGHGQTCMEGYRAAVDRGIPHVFQIDSDGQCDPRYFSGFWKIRDQHDVIYGKRTREDGYRRKLASLVLRISLMVFCRVNCIDANVPYRLMKTSRCREAFQRIPQDVFLANVALAVILRRTPGINHGSVPIRFLERHGGEPSVPISKFAEKAFELFRQLATLPQN